MQMMESKGLCPTQEYIDRQCQAKQREVPRAIKAVTQALLNRDAVPWKPGAEAITQKVASAEFKTVNASFRVEFESAPPPEGEEWSQSTRYWQWQIKNGVCIMGRWVNLATMVGASQDGIRTLASDEKFCAWNDAEAVAAWEKDLLKLLQVRPPSAIEVDDGPEGKAMRELPEPWRPWEKLTRWPLTSPEPE